MGNLGPTELIIIAVVIILLFGAKKLPDMARSLGKSAKIFKAETKGLRDNQDADDAPVQQQPVQQPVQQLPRLSRSRSSSPRSRLPSSRPRRTRRTTDLPVS